MTRIVKKRAPKRKTAKKAKSPAPRLVEHRTLGVCTLRCIRALDSNDLVAVVEFSDGTERVIRLDERFWLTRITDMMQTPVAPTRKRQPAEGDTEASAAVDEDAAETETVVELALNEDGHLGDGEADSEDEAEEDELVSEGSEKVSRVLL